MTIVDTVVETTKAVTTRSANVENDGHQQSVTRIRTREVVLTEGFPQFHTERYGRQSMFEANRIWIKWTEEADWDPDTGRQDGPVRWVAPWMSVSGPNIKTNGDMGKLVVGNQYYVNMADNPDWVKKIFADYHPVTGKWPFDTKVVHD